MDAKDVASLYDAHYYATGCGDAYERNEKWLRFFGGIAQRIIEEINPETILDAGCAMGFLVEGFRRRGVKAYGVDISEYAIANVHQDIKPYCQVASITEPFAQKYNLIVSIEVLEHLPKSDAEKAVANLCQHANDILFSSTPFDYKEITHFNVQPPEYWAEQFARHNFYRDVDFDASFITPWAVRFRQRSEPVHRIIKDYERRYWLLGKENTDLRALTGEMRQDVRSAELQLQAMNTHARRLESRWQEVEGSVGWSLLQTLQQSRAALFPPGSRRDEWLDAFFDVLRRQKLTELFTFLGRGVKKQLPIQTSADVNRHSDLAPAKYQDWIKRNKPTANELKQQHTQSQNFSYTPLISFITPVYNTPLDVLQETIESVLAQTYSHWELCLVNGGSDRVGVKKVLDRFVQRDSRILVRHLDKNLGISGNSDEALMMASGEYIAILDHDDLVAPTMLFEVVQALNKNPQTDIIYFDEDKLSQDGRIRLEPFFKPDWSPHLLLSTNYLMHSVFRRELVLKVGMFSSEMDGAQDWDLAFRCVEQTNQIVHIPKILYHWRKMAGSAAGDANAKLWAIEAQIRSVTNHLVRQGARGAQVTQPQPGIVRVQFEHSNPKVSIIIPTKDKADLLLTCLSSIFSRTAYQNYEIIVIDNGSTEAATLHYFELLTHNPKVKIIQHPGQFNFSEVNNLGVKHAAGDVFVFLNNDTEVLDADWLDDLVGWAVQPNVGIAGAKLIRPDDTIQHAGIIMGLAGHGSHIYDGALEDRYGIFGRAEWYRDYQAVTGACIAVRREVFEELGGFDETYRIGYGDIDLCLRAVSANYSVVYTPFARLRHFEGGSRGFFVPPSDVFRASIKMLPLIKSDDPFFNPNLSYAQRIPALAHPNEEAKEERILRIMRHFKLLEGGLPEELETLHLQFEEILKPTSSLLSGDGAKFSGRKAMFVTHDLSLSGAPLILLLLARYLKSAGYQITLISPKEGPLQAKYIDAGIEVQINPTVLDDKKVQGNAIAIALTMKDYDFVFANTVLNWNVIHVARALQKPSIWWIHESGRGKDLATSRPEIATAFATANAVVFPAQSTASLYADFTQKDNYHILPHGLDLALIKASIDKPVEKLNKFSIVHVGSIEPRKGQDVLLQAIKSLPANARQNTGCYFVGRVLDEAFYAKVQKMAQNIQNIHFVGQKPYEQVLAYIQMADVFALTSRDEVLPITILEAMALQKTVLATKVGGIAEIIEHNQNGLLVASEDYQDVASNLARLFNHPAHLSRLGNAARQTFDARLTIEHFGQNIIKMIEAINFG